MEARMKFELIERFLKEKNITKEEFCKLCKITARTYAMIRENNLLVRAKEVSKVIYVLGITMNGFIER